MKLAKLLTEISYQPNHWRKDYAECFDFINGEQFTAEQIEKAEKLNLNLRQFNLIRAPINSLTGSEVKTRVDYLLKARSEESYNGTMALNAELNRAEKTISLSDKISKSFYSAAVGGCGFIRIGENTEVGSRYHAEQIPTENFYWDMTRDGELFDNTRWCVVRTNLSVDEAIAMYPKQKADIEAQKNTDAGSISFSNGTAFSFDTGMFDNTFRTQVFNEIDDIITIHEVFYKKKKRVEIFTSKDGTQHLVSSIDKQLAQNLRLSKKTAWKTDIEIWRTVYLGYMQIEDKKADQPHNFFPIVPIFNELSNKWNAPIGIVKHAIDPQKQYNEHRLEMQKIMRNKQIVFEQDSIVGLSNFEIINEINRADSALEIKQGKKFPMIKREFQDLSRFAELIRLDQQNIRECTGLTKSFTGEADGLSGKAIASNAELAGSSVISLFDAKDKMRTRIGEILLSHIIADMGDDEVDIETEADKKISFNQKMDGGVLNPIAEIKYDIQLASIKTSAGFKQLQADRLTSLANNSREPTMQAVLQLLALELEDLPNKKEVLPILHKKLGLDGLGEDKDAAEQRAANEAEAAKQQEMIAQQQMELATADKEADIAVKNADAQLKLAQAQKALAEAQQPQEQPQVEQPSKQDEEVNNAFNEYVKQAEASQAI
ncbi:MAG: hypothetical protein FXV80_06215 [Candidatus Thioglobus sp.]|nr:MAG: hypothetical protein FXV80_06215 [Candidatus Thioglobus sp.]